MLSPDRCHHCNIAVPRAASRCPVCGAPVIAHRLADDGPRAVFPAMGFTEADYAMAYAKDAFKRLTGHSAADRRAHVRSAGTKAEQAMAYAEDTFARMRGIRPAHPHDPVARGARTAGTQADRAMVYANEMFRRLRGLPAQEPLHSDRRQNEPCQRGFWRPRRSGGGLCNAGRRHLHMARTAMPAPSFVDEPFPIATAIRRGIGRLALLIRGSILEPYARRRRRRIAISQLRALDDRLLADIGVQRNVIEWVVDGLLARRDNVVSPPAARSGPSENRRHDLPLAA